MFFWLCFVAAGVCTVSCFGSGPPSRISVCEEGIPDNTSIHSQGTGNGGFTISTDLDFNLTGEGLYNFISAQTYTGQCLPEETWVGGTAKKFLKILH